MHRRGGRFSRRRRVHRNARILRRLRVALTVLLALVAGRRRHRRTQRLRSRQMREAVVPEHLGGLLGDRRIRLAGSSMRSS